MEDVNNRGSWSLWQFSIISSQFFCKSESVLRNEVCYQFKKGTTGTVPGTGMSETWPCPYKAKACQSTGM